jgi:hypothetical protein
MEGNMIYIYNCYGGTHSSSIASAVHLKKLPADRIPTKQEILDIDQFNKLTYKDMGRIIYRGIDDEGNKVYTLGRGTSKVLVPCLQNLILLLTRECGLQDRLVFSNMSPTVPPAMTMGGFFSRGLGIHFIGVPLLVIGAKQAYMNIVRLVDLTKDAAKKTNEPVLVLKNDT